MLNQRKDSVTYDHMSLMMKALGKFHAISFAIKDQQPEKFKQFASFVSEQFWNGSNSDFGDHFKMMFNRMEKLLEEENRYDLLDKVKQSVIKGLPATAKYLVSSEAAEPYAVICHGDLTTNNTMFCNDKNKNPTEIQMFDWQFSRYASPVTDLVIYLFCCSTKELRKSHEDFLKIYHDSLSNLLIR